MFLAIMEMVGFETGSIILFFIQASPGPEAP